MIFIIKNLNTKLIGAQKCVLKYFSFLDDLMCFSDSSSKLENMVPASFLVKRIETGYLSYTSYWLPG